MKLRLILHVFAQILAQGAVFALLKNHSPEAIYAAVIAIVGVILAFLDTSASPLT